MNTKRTTLLFFILLTLGPISGLMSSEFNAYISKERLTSSLGLSPDQVEKVGRLFRMLEGQKKKDRSVYADNIDGLYMRAVERRNMQDQYIQKILAPNQVDRFKHLTRHRDRYFEFFIINETLMPSRNQSAKIHVLLDEYQEKIKGMKHAGPKKQESEYSPKRGMKPGGGGYLPPGAIRRGRQYHGKSSPMEKLNKEKYDRIAEYLTPEQKKRFPKVRILLNKEFVKRWKKKQEQNPYPHR